MIFLDEDAYPVFVPQNEGMLRPVKVIAPKGSIFNPNYPRACFARFCQVQRAVDLVLRALAPVVPEQITAGNSAHLHFISYSGFNAETQEYWVYLEVDEGSYGGRPDARRPRLGRLPDREHAQQPDRGARVALPDADRALRAARRAVRGRPVRAAGSAWCASTASSSTRSSPARASGTIPTRRGASSAATTA